MSYTWEIGIAFMIKKWLPRIAVVIGICIIIGAFVVSFTQRDEYALRDGKIIQEIGKYEDMVTIEGSYYSVYKVKFKDRCFYVFSGKRDSWSIEEECKGDFYE